VWAFLGCRAKDEHRSVVFLGEELERGSIFKRMDFIFLGELLGEWNAQLVEVCEGILDDL
jgi:hypothetical protein